MKILFIGEPASIHAIRWIRQFKNTGWDISIFSGSQQTVRPLRDLDFGHLYSSEAIEASPGVDVRRIPHANSPAEIGEILAQVIRELNPDIVHSLGLCVNWENRALPVAVAKEILKTSFTAPWIYSSWGADLDFYASNPANTPDVIRSLRLMDFHVSECLRDEALARQLGFQGTTLERLPAFGGTTWNCSPPLEMPSRRRSIVIKGRDALDGDPVGRASHILFALLACADVLDGYSIRILQAGRQIQAWAQQMRRISKLQIEVIPRLTDHTDVLSLMASSRAFISMTINDGLPSSLVEAMSLGCLPIHSCLDPICEWIKHEENGLLPEVGDLPALVDCIRRGVTDDALVESAAVKNRLLVGTHLSDNIVKEKAFGNYLKALQRHHALKEHLSPRPTSMS